MSSQPPQSHWRDRLAATSPASQWLPRSLRQRLLTDDPDSHRALYRHFREKLDFSQSPGDYRKAWQKIINLEKSGLPLSEEFLDFLVSRFCQVISQELSRFQIGPLDTMLLKISSLRSSHLVRFYRTLEAHPDHFSRHSLDRILKKLLTHENADLRVLAELSRTHRQWASGELSNKDLGRAVQQALRARMVGTESGFLEVPSHRFAGQQVNFSSMSGLFALSDLTDPAVREMLVRSHDPGIIEKLLEHPAGDERELFKLLADMAPQRAGVALEAHRAVLAPVLGREDLTPLMVSRSDQARRQAFDFLAHIHHGETSRRGPDPKDYLSSEER